MAHIATPCPEDWDKMTGNEQKRHCAGCGCHVLNVAEMKAGEAEALVSLPERTCVRLTFDENRSVLTLDGWIPRMLLAGAVAATVSGCGHKDAKLDFSGASTSVATSTTTSSGPSPFEVIEEKLEELIDDIKEAISPGSTRHTIVMGFISDRPTTTIKPSSGP